MKYAIHVILVIFLIIAGVELYMIFQKILSYQHQHILTLILLGLFLKRTNKATWVLLALMCIYGLYDTLFLGIRASDTTAMDLTGSLIWFMYDENTKGVGRRIISLFPIILYLSTFIYLLTTWGRRQYKLY